MRATDSTGLAELIPAERPPTRAEDALARYRSTHPAPRVASASRRSQYAVGEPPETSLNRAAEISRRRVSLEEALKALGNPDGRPARQQMLRLDLTPWCQVQIDLRQLAEKNLGGGLRDLEFHHA